MLERLPDKVANHWALHCKRAFDISASLVLSSLLSPFLLVVAIAIKLESPGPVFYRQQRRGRHFRPITIWKFRSMRHGVPDPHPQYETLESDPRITRVGSFIRKTSVDELPQLFNVIGGTMSLVGPRPLIEWESRRALATHPDRFLLPPGITGLSQITVRNAVEFETRLDHDVEYVHRWSFILDLAILFKTPWHVICGGKVYPNADGH